MKNTLGHAVANRIRRVHAARPWILSSVLERAARRARTLVASALAAATLATLALAPAASAQAPGNGAPAIPASMTAVRFHEYGGAERLRVERAPVPAPRAGEILVEVHAASVNPIDWKLREGLVQSWWPLRLPSIPGRDAAGIVRAIGAGVTRWRVGDAVAVYVPSSALGTYAEYVLVEAEHAVAKPASQSFVEAAAWPLVGITAWNAVENAKVGSGDTVLVHGGAGGVGSLVVQLAAARGARVVATASARNVEFVRGLGAAQVVDYRAARFEDAVRDVDAVIDTVGGETLARSPAVLKRGGRLVTIAGRLPKEACASGGLECVGSNAGEPARALSELAPLVAAGKLNVVVDRTFPLENAAEAQEALRAGGGRGKIVLRVR